MLLAEKIEFLREKAIYLTMHFSNHQWDVSWGGTPGDLKFTMGTTLDEALDKMVALVGG